ncbi:MAG: ABC transporter ATP-binding protein [Hyphomonas sp.]
MSSPAYRLTVPDFRMGPGDRIGLVGESGAGKSTFLDILALVRRPDEVTGFRLMGADLSEDLRRGRLDALSRLRARHVGYILQDGGLLPYLTVRRNAAVAQRLAGSQECLKAHALHLGLEFSLDKLPSALSGGQRQRAAVLRGLASGARILLADEPTASLDSGNARQTMRLLGELPRDRAILVCSHQEDLLRETGFRIMRMTTRMTGPGLIEAELSEAAA